MSNQQQDSSNMLVPVLFIVMGIGAALYFFVFPIPIVRTMVYLALTAVKMAGALIVLDFSAITELASIAKALIVGLKAGAKINPGAVYAAIINASPLPWLPGVVITAFMAIPAAFILLGKKDLSEEKVVKKQIAKSLPEVLEDWGVKDGFSGEEPPMELADKFSQIREIKNIPPNIIARKLRDPLRRVALLHFNRVVKNQEVFRKVTDPEDLKKLMLKP